MSKRERGTCKHCGKMRYREQLVLRRYSGGKNRERFCSDKCWTEYIARKSATANDLQRRSCACGCTTGLVVGKGIFCGSLWFVDHDHKTLYEGKKQADAAARFRYGYRFQYGPRPEPPKPPEPQTFNDFYRILMEHLDAGTNPYQKAGQEHTPNVDDE